MLVALNHHLERQRNYSQQVIKCVNDWASQVTQRSCFAKSGLPACGSCGRSSGGKTFVEFLEGAKASAGNITLLLDN